MKKTIIFGILLITTFGCATDDKKEAKTTVKTKSTAILPLVQIAKASKTSFIHKISIQGNIESPQDILLNTEMSGMIQEVKVSAGSQVKMGQTLLVMDASILSANIQELESQLEFAQYMLGKQNELHAQDLGTEFDQKSAENQVKSLEAKLNTLNIQKSKMTVQAPFDGTIDQVFAKKGQLSSPQMPLMRLVNTDLTEVIASVSEKHFKNIKKGTEIKVNFPNYDLKAIRTKVSSIGSYIEPTNRTFTIRADVVNNVGLMPNMLAELEITDFKVDSGMVVPSKSILKNAKNQDYLWVLTPATQDKYSVTQVFINTIKVYKGQALIEENKYLVNDALVIEGGGRGITMKDLVRIK